MLELLLTLTLAGAERVPDAPRDDCASCPAWNADQPPFRVFGNTWYVGTRGLGAVLIDSGAGLVLIDGGLPQSAEKIARSIETLGFELAEVEWILSSHAHFDHAGGIAALARWSGAKVAASPRGAQALRKGMPDAEDPQAGLGAWMRFPPLADVVEIAWGEALEIGGLRIVAQASPGHTPGGTSWTWRSCEGARCVDVVCADSLTSVSAEGFRYSDDPERVATFRESIERIGTLPCDVLLTTHPDFAHTFDRRARQEEGDPDAFIDPGACAAFAAVARRALTKRLAAERAALPVDR